MATCMLKKKKERRGREKEQWWSVGVGVWR